MKLQYKFLLMIVLFFGIIVFGSQNCFAFNATDYDKYYKTAENKSDFLDLNLPYTDNFSLSDLYGEGDKSDLGNFIYFSYLNKNDNCKYYMLYYGLQEGLYWLYDPKDGSPCWLGQYGISPTAGNLYLQQSRYIGLKIQENGEVKKLSRDFTYGSSEYIYANTLNDIEILYATSDVLLRETGTNNYTLYYSHGYNPVEPDVDKLNLYELNLTDLDYNNQVHQFNLAMYTDSVCYDDVMNRYNSDCPYAIFVTDYTRVLTYDSESNMNLQRGAYLLSGYIDYLITDKSFFYFSEHYNRYMRHGGRFF